MYVCMHVCMYVCMYVCLCVFVCVACVYVYCVRLRAYVKPILVRSLVHLFVCLSVHLSASLRTF